MKNYDSLDLLKLILSLMIVAIHTQLFPMILYPWLRIAVPLFFISSSFLLFKKIKKNPNNEREILKKYITRQMKYYIFWFIILLPITIYIRLNWFSNGLLVGLIKIITSTLFSSTFIASWFIVANCEGIVIITFLSKNNKKLLFLIALFLYFICCVLSSYITVLDDSNCFKILVINYEKYMPSFIFSFPVSLIYIILGKYFSENENKIKIKVKDYLALILSCILLFIEWKLCFKITETYNNDCYFMILPCSYYIFKIIFSKQIHIKFSKSLRIFSIICYPLHGSIQTVIGFILEKFITNTNIVGLLNFLITLFCCFIAYFLIRKLENSKKFKFLKYSH